MKTLHHYRGVDQLTSAEFEELKACYCLEKEVWDVSDQEVMDHYAGTLFTDEDFLCNI